MKESSSNKSSISEDQSAQAAASLQLLLREDPGLLKLVGEKTTTPPKNPNEETNSFAYAAELLKDDSSSGGGVSDTQARAEAALQDVERKLALTESLAVKLSRQSPEAVASHLLKLHGHAVAASAPSSSKELLSSNNETAATTTTSLTLSTIRDRSVRLEKTAESLEATAKRVETALSRSLTRMQTATTKLQRCLDVSLTLKMVLRLQFETQKLAGYDLEDLRDLTRAAASVAVLEDLFDKFDARSGSGSIAVVEHMRSPARAAGIAVREAAETLMASSNYQQLGAVLTVYYHLGELPSAVWQSVDAAHATAVTACKMLFDTVDTTSSSSLGTKQARSLAAKQWADALLQACDIVRNLETVVTVKTDPVSRQKFVHVLKTAPIPEEYIIDTAAASEGFSIFGLFWARLCRSLADVIRDVLQSGRKDGIAELYPAVRAAALRLVAQLQDSVSNEMATTTGILGGSASMDDGFLDWNTGRNKNDGLSSETTNPQSASDSWTKKSSQNVVVSYQRSATTASSSSNMSAVANTKEWKTLQGRGNSPMGLYLLQQAFLSAVQERLTAPLRYMFPENVALDDDGIAVHSGLSLLPSKYDVQRFDENIRQELALADPREGGGDLVTMIADAVVSMISEFCVCAKNAMSGVGENGYLNAADWSMTESLQHDRKVVAIMYTLKNYLTTAPEKTFVAPYRPAVQPQHLAAAELCKKALAPALEDIDATVKLVVLLPLCRALNRNISSVLAKLHSSGVYRSNGGSVEEDNNNVPSFIQKEVTQIVDIIAQQHLARFPPVYASVIASHVTAYTIYTFLSNASLLRPLGESARLHITQDLADLEMALEQIVTKTGLTLNGIANGKPYAELRAVRQMLFWTGLENKSKSADEIAKSLLRENWMKDVRPSTVFHYLFSFGGSLLSSPHHVKHMTASEYVASILVKLDGSTQEDDSWMTVMSCCDSYQQRASAGKSHDGDPRVAQIVMTLGQELLRRRQHN